MDTYLEILTDTILFLKAERTQMEELNAPDLSVIEAFQKTEEYLRESYQKLKDEGN